MSQRQFLSELLIRIRSGRGGSGCESFMRRSDHKMLPNGGDGGKGGSVIIQADAKTGTLLDLKNKRVYEAAFGQSGGANNCYGRNGSNLILRVPCGTSVFDHAQSLLMRDLVNDGDQVVVAEGGRQGYGNHSGRPATRGEDGVELEVLLSIAVIADIFIVGLPNSGKSMLLRALTGAHVESTDYPFSTKIPCLGTYDSGVKELRLCELPSLYEHSRIGRGLGVSCLKHLKRAKLIILMTSADNTFSKGIQKDFDMLLNMIKDYDPRLLQIPRLHVLNKADLMTPSALKKLPKRGMPVIAISALTGKGLKDLMKKASAMMKKSGIKSDE